MTNTWNNCFPACCCFSWLSPPRATLRKSACHSICWGIEWTRFFACSQAPAASTLYVSMLPHVEASKQNDSFQIRNCFPRHQKKQQSAKTAEASTRSHNTQKRRHSHPADQQPRRHSHNVRDAATGVTASSLCMGFLYKGIHAGLVCFCAS